MNEQVTVDQLQSTGTASISAPATRQNIIWLASYPKSGNTWVRVLLENLCREPGAEPVDINRLSPSVAWENRAARYEYLLGKRVTDASHNEIARLRPQIQAELAGSRAHPFLAKTHLCLANDGVTPMINLSATLAAIYIVRNPLDVAISYSHHLGIGIDAMIGVMATSGFVIPSGGKSIFEVLGSWSEHVASWIGLAHRPVLILRYEDLAADPLRPLTMLAHFLGLQPSEDQLKAAIAKSSFSELRRQEAANGFRERPQTTQAFFRQGYAGQWRDVLTRSQIAEIVRVHEPMMQRFGYLPPRAGASLPPSLSPRMAVHSPREAGPCL